MKKILFLIILIILLLPNVFATVEYQAQRGGFKAYGPEKINIFEPFTIKLVVIDQEFADKVDYFSLGDCAIPFEIASGYKKTDSEFITTDKPYEGIFYKYNGEKEIDLVLSAYSDNGSLNFIGIGDSDRLTIRSCDIWFKGEEITETTNYVGIRYDYYDFDFGIKNLPSDYILDDKHAWTSVYANYKMKTDSQENTLSLRTVGFKKDSKTFYTYEEISNGDLFLKSYKGIVPKDYTFEKITVGNSSAILMYKCDTFQNYSNKEEYRANCDIKSQIILPTGPIEISLKAKQNNYVSEFEINEIIDTWKKTVTDALENVYFGSEGKTKQIDIKEESNNDCSNCEIGFVCSACGECIKETKASNIKDLTVEMDLKVTHSTKKIVNSIDSQILYRAYPNVSFKDSEGKEVPYCNIKDPGPKVNISGSLISEEQYSGFTSGFITDQRERSLSCELDLNQKKPYCTFIVNPNDEKKFISDAKDIVQEFEFKAEILNEYQTEKKELILTVPTFTLSLNAKSPEVQQGNTGVLKITPKGGTTNRIILKTTLLGPGKIGLESKNLNTDWILEVVDSGDTLKLGYLSPSMGNFDIGKELQSLSMVQLQTDAAKQIAQDALMAYGGEYVSGVEALVDAGEYSKKMGHLTDAFKIANGAKNLRGINDSIPGLTDEVGDAVGVNDQKKDAGWVERGADIGVAGISIAQTVVGVVTFIPNKIPGVNKLTAGVQTAFSAATNIWKANLKYISKSEKIERAREVYYPSPVVVTAQDISGWIVQDIYVFKIVYHQLD